MYLLNYFDIHSIYRRGLSLVAHHILLMLLLFVGSQKPEVGKVLSTKLFSLSNYIYYSITLNRLLILAN